MTTRKPLPERRKPIALSVVPTSGAWHVRREGARRASGVYESKAEAVAAARIILGKAGGVLRVKGKNGRLTESLTLGRNAAKKMAAVEGNSLDGGIQRDLRSFDRESLRPEERRSRIRDTYGSGGKSGR